MVNTNRVCNYCNKPFYARPNHIEKGWAKHCSRQCSAAALKKLNAEIKLPNAACGTCGKQLRVKPHKLTQSKTGYFFCSKECKNIAQRLDGIKEIHPSHYGTGEFSYRTLCKRLKILNECSRCGWNKHPEILQVHHKDRDRQNNNIDNLDVLCPNCHAWEHYVGKDGLYHTLNKSMGAESKAG